ncbi:hypothetical protein HY969_03830 [Candidatus Kaiserbacteria bacterium]|nr:hypothetical protein [Candidatus Kaiserbacteria bacterium]
MGEEDIEPLRPTIEVLQLSANDWEKLRDIKLQALRDEPLAYGDTHEKALARSEQEWRGALEKDHYLSAMQGNLIVGIARVDFDEGGGRMPHIYTMSMLRLMRGAGVLLKN